MDLLDEARRNAQMAWWRGQRWFGPVLPEDEAVAIGVAALFELQASLPDAPRSEMARGVRTRVLNAMRDEVRFVRREVPLAAGLDVEATASAPETRLDATERLDWLTGKLDGLAWNDRRLLDETWLRSSTARLDAVPPRFGSRWTIRRGLDRVLLALRESAARRFGVVA